MNVGKLNRWLHYWLSLAILLPVAMIIGSGLLLVFKKDVNWNQPPSARGAGTVPEIGFDQILAAAARVDDAEIAGSGDIDRLDVRPGKGMVKVRANSNWEIQVDTATGEVLQTAFRRSDIIESIHDGSFFGGPVKFWVVLPTGIVLAVMWGTGVYLFVLPFLQKRKNRRRRAARTAAAA